MTKIHRLDKQDTDRLLAILSESTKERKVEMDVTGKYLIIEKHRRVGGKKARRRFNDKENIPTMIELAKGYAEQRGEDFLIVQVIAEVSKSKGQEEG